MAEPPGIVVGRRAGRLGDPFEDRSEDDQGESFPRLAVGGGGEYVAGEVDDMAASGVAVEDLEEEQSDRGDGVEEAFAQEYPASRQASRMASGASRWATSRRSLERTGRMGSGMGGLRLAARWVGINPQDARRRPAAQGATSRSLIRV